MFYSKSTKGFYTTEIHGKNIPSDCVEISEELHRKLLDLQSSGKIIVPDNNGHPVAVNPAPAKITWEQIKAKRDTLLKDSDWIDLPNSPVKNKQAWLDYRQALRDLPETFETPESVVWPKSPNK